MRVLRGPASCCRKARQVNQITRRVQHGYIFDGHLQLAGDTPQVCTDRRTCGIPKNASRVRYRLPETVLGIPGGDPHDVFTGLSACITQANLSP